MQNRISGNISKLRRETGLTQKELAEQLGVSFQTVSKWGYLIMGWMIVIASEQLFTSLPRTGLLFLICGGLFYTLGVLFYIWKSRQYTHAIWHFFVLSGTTMHFFAVLYSCVLL